MCKWDQIKKQWPFSDLSNKFAIHLIMWGKKIEKYDCLDLYHAQCFPQCLLFVSPVLWENNSYLENLFSSKSKKLYQQNTSVVLVSVKNSAHLSADAQISPDLPCVYILGHESLEFWLFWRKTRGFEHQLSWASSGRDWADLACLLCPGGLDLPCVFESWPNTSCYGTSNWSNKRVLTQYWVISTNQSKEDLSFGQAFKHPRQAQANSQLNQKTTTRYSKVALGGVVNILGIPVVHLV